MELKKSSGPRVGTPQSLVSTPGPISYGEFSRLDSERGDFSRSLLRSVDMSLNRVSVWEFLQFIIYSFFEVGFLSFKILIFL